MNTLRAIVLLFVALACAAARADDLYFGGSGDTNTHWVGYLASVGAHPITWTAYTLDPDKRGRIKIAPATFSPAGTNAWTAIFDEYVLRTNGAAIGLAYHHIHITSRRDRQSIQVQDGKEAFDLLRLSPEDLRAIKRGRIPSQTLQPMPGSRSSLHSDATGPAPPG